MHFSILTLIRLINGLATLILGIPSFIITLATALFWAGVSLNLTGGYPISYFGDSPVMSWLGTAEIGHSKIAVSSLWLVGFAIILAAVLRMTAVGNWIFASGGDGRDHASLPPRRRRVRASTMPMPNASASIDDPP